MGRIESEYNKRRVRANLQSVILSTIALGGLLSVAIVAPNVIQVLRKTGILPKKRQKESVMSATERLIEKGLLVREGLFLRITPEGEKRLDMLEARSKGLLKPKRWDGRWRVLIFDIPETRKVIRNKLRQTLHEVGFRRLQDSVWLYPYPSDDFVALLKSDFKIGKDMQYMIVESLEADKPFRKLFGLT